MAAATKASGLPFEAQGNAALKKREQSSGQNGGFRAVFPQGGRKKFDTSKFLLYTLCFVRASPA
jgi:hypothetical protein